MKSLGLLILGAIVALVIAKLFPRLFVFCLIVYGGLVYFRSSSGF